MTVEVIITPPSPVEVSATSAPTELTITPPAAVTVTATPPEPITVDVTVAEPIEINVAAQGVPGPIGPSGPTELYDSDTPPVFPSTTYLRFERDVDGDVQTIYLGTED